MKFYKKIRWKCCYCKFKFMTLFDSWFALKDRAVRFSKMVEQLLRQQTLRCVDCLFVNWKLEIWYRQTNIDTDKITCLPFLWLFQLLCEQSILVFNAGQLHRCLGVLYWNFFQLWLNSFQLYSSIHWSLLFVYLVFIQHFQFLRTSLQFRSTILFKGKKLS